MSTIPYQALWYFFSVYLPGFEDKFFLIPSGGHYLPKEFLIGMYHLSCQVLTLLQAKTSFFPSLIFRNGLQDPWLFFDLLDLAIDKCSPKIQLNVIL